MDDQSNDDIVLPQDTLDILNQFLTERALKEKKEQECIEIKNIGDHDVQFVNFEENWQLSQFWYNNSTKLKLTSVVQKLADNLNIAVGLLSCPSLFNSVKMVHSNTKILEFDMRFSAFGDDFIFYDFNQADVPDYLSNYYNYFDLIIVDPPFLSEECIEKVSIIIKKISKTNTKIIFCSGETVEPWIKKHLKLQKCDFRPEHERNLGNAFVSYANFNLDELL